MPRTPSRSTVITDRQHPAISRIRELGAREVRDRTGLFFAEGMRALACAARHQRRIKQLVVCSELLTSPFGRKLVQRLRRGGTACLFVSAAVFDDVARQEEPQGVGAVLWQRLERLRPERTRPGACWVALETVQSPGNLGTIIRTVDAAGADGVILVGEDVDPFHPMVVRASMGSLFARRIVRTSLDGLMEWKERHGMLLVGTSPSAPADYRDVAYPAPVVLFMGWERRGLSRAGQARCDVMVRIPMAGEADSLNLAVATGIVLYEVYHQHHAGLGAQSEAPFPLGKGVGG